MKVIEQYSEVDPQTGQRLTGRREVEVPGTLTDAEAREATIQDARTERRAQLREQILEALVAGDDPAALRAEYVKLRE